MELNRETLEMNKHFKDNPDSVFLFAFDKSSLTNDGKRYYSIATTKGDIKDACDRLKNILSNEL